jgi:hypothetical protein
MIEQYDDNMIRCPRIGGEVSFLFCRTENNMLPCRWIAGCWKGLIEIQTFLEAHYIQKELEQIFIPPKPKVESLVNLVEKAKKANNPGD